MTAGRIAPSTMALLAMSVVMFAWVGLIAIGVSRVVAQVMGTALGAGFVAGDVPGVTYTSDRCADFAEYAPGATNCADAAASHHFDETVTYRVAAGAVGFVVLLVWLLARRRTAAAPLFALPPGIVAGAGAATFGVVGLALLADGLARLALGPNTGAGSDLSAAVVALPIAAAYAAQLYRSLVGRPTWV